jgi:molybdate transport system substrate-binding protein
MKMLVVLLFCSVLTAPGSQAAGDLRISAASDLKFALDEIIAAFTRAHGQSATKASYGASGNLFAQIQNGAPFDIFLSADTNYPLRLIESGHATNFFLYAEGHLALWVPNSSTLDLEKAGLKAVLDPSVRKIAIANPAHAPYGRAAVAALKEAGVYDRITNSLVLGENIAQTAQFVQSGGADIGVLGLSIIHSPAMRDKGRHFEIPLALQQGGVLIARSKNLATAGSFRDFLTGNEARAILARYGLAPK